MKFGWINWLNAAVVFYLIMVNIIAVKKGTADAFKSDYFSINLMEQIGRYGCIAFMVLPVMKGWKFGFASVQAMIVWLCVTVGLSAAYGVLWMKKSRGGRAVVYGLALIPACLFFMNGCLLRHTLLTACSLVFGVFHLLICVRAVRDGV